MGYEGDKPQTRKTKKIIEAVKLQKGDRAITYHVIASEYKWTIEQIEDADALKLKEMMLVMQTINNKEKGKLKISNYGGCVFVPLVGKYGW